MIAKSKGFKRLKRGLKKIEPPRRKWWEELEAVDAAFNKIMMPSSLPGFHWVRKPNPNDGTGFSWYEEKIKAQVNEYIELMDSESGVLRMSMELLSVIIIDSMEKMKED